MKQNNSYIIRLLEKQRALLGIAWFLVSILLCLLNDIIIKAIDARISSYQICFLRFFISSLTLLPFLAKRGLKYVKTKYIKTHLFRSLALLSSTCLWFHGIPKVPLATITIISFSIPIFTVVFAKFFLQESIGFKRGLASSVGFFGILSTVKVNSEDFQLQAWPLILAAMIYAALNIANKKIANKESTFNMLFHSSLMGSLSLAPIAYTFWQTPALLDFLGLISLGLCANLIMFCVIKAYQMTEISFLAPWYYVELILSIAFGFLLFQELPSTKTLLCALLILASVSWLSLPKKS